MGDVVISPAAVAALTSVGGAIALMVAALFRALIGAKDQQIKRETTATDTLLPAQRETTATLAKLLEVQTLSSQKFDRLDQRLERIERLERPGRGRRDDEGG